MFGEHAYLTNGPHIRWYVSRTLATCGLQRRYADNFWRAVAASCLPIATQVAPQIFAQKLSCLSAYPCCVSTWQEHYDLHDTPHVSNGRLPLPSARKTEVYPIWINLGVALFDTLFFPSACLRSSLALPLPCLLCRHPPVLHHMLSVGDLDAQASPVGDCLEMLHIFVFRAEGRLRIQQQSLRL